MTKEDTPRKMRIRQWNWNYPILDLVQLRLRYLTETFWHLESYTKIEPNTLDYGALWAGTLPKGMGPKDPYPKTKDLDLHQVLVAIFHHLPIRAWRELQMLAMRGWGFTPAVLGEAPLQKL